MSTNTYRPKTPQLILDLYQGWLLFHGESTPRWGTYLEKNQEYSIQTVAEHKSSFMRFAVRMNVLLRHFLGKSKMWRGYQRVIEWDLLVLACEVHDDGEQYLFRRHQMPEKDFYKKRIGHTMYEYRTYRDHLNHSENNPVMRRAMLDAYALQHCVDPDFLEQLSQENDADDIKRILNLRSSEGSLVAAHLFNAYESLEYLLWPFQQLQEINVNTALIETARNQLPRITQLFDKLPFLKPFLESEGILQWMQWLVECEPLTQEPQAESPA